MSTMIFPALAGSAAEHPAKPSLFQRLAFAMAESRRRKAQRIINERELFFGPSLLEAAGFKHISLDNDDLLPLR